MKLGNWLTMLHSVWLTIFPRHLRALLSLHRLTILHRDGLANLSWHGGTLLSGNLLTVLRGNIAALLMGNINAVSLRDLLTPLPAYWLTFLLRNRLADLLREILAVLLFHRATFFSWNLSCHFGAMRFGNGVTFSLSCWFALLVRHFSASWLLMFADLSRYLGTALTWCNWQPSQGSEAQRTKMGAVPEPLIFCLVVTLFLP